MAKKFQVDTNNTLNTGLVSYYKCEDATDFFSTKNLTNNGSMPFNAGKVSNAADGGATNTTKYLSILNNMGVDGGNCSLACWINMTTDPASEVQNGFVSQYNSTSKVAYEIFYYNNAGTIQIWFNRLKNGTANQTVNINFTFVTGTWYHLVMTYDGTNIEGWKDGVSQGTTAASGNGSTAVTDSFFIGIRQNTVGFINGLIDEAGIWSKKLSNQEVADLYNGGSGQTMVSSVAVPGNLLTMKVG